MLHLSRVAFHIRVQNQHTNPNITQGAGKNKKKRRKNTNGRQRFKCLSRRHIDKPRLHGQGVQSCRDPELQSPDADDADPLAGTVALVLI